MPNYSLVANNVFKNRSFEDLLKPLAMYTEEYNTQEAAINDLAIKADVWDGMAKEETDPIAYAQQKRYADDLRSQADALARNGLTSDTRRAILNLRRRYASEITPIEQAFTNRKTQADEQRKALLQNPTLLFSRRADTTSLDDYLKDPKLGYDQYSGALLTQQAAQAAQAIAKELKAYGRGKPLDAYTNTWLQQHGFTSAQVAQAINHPDDPTSAKVLNTIVANVIADSGVPQWADRKILDQAYSYARQGLWQAVGQTNVEKYDNYGARLAAKEDMERRIARYKNSLSGKSNLAVKVPLLNPQALRSQEALSAAGNKVQLYKQFFDYNPKTGAVKLNANGIREYYKTHYNSTAPGGGTLSQSAFKTFIDGLGGAGYFNSKGGVAVGRVGNLFAKYARDNKDGSYDTYHSTEYVRQLGGTYAKGLGEQLKAAKNIKAVDFNGKNGWKEKSVDQSVLNSLVPIRVNYSKYGTTVTLGIKDGLSDDKRKEAEKTLKKYGNATSLRIKMPKTMNPGIDRSVNDFARQADEYDAIIRKGYMPKLNNGYITYDKNGDIVYTNQPLTENERAFYVTKRAESIMSMQDAGANYFVGSKTADEEYTPHNYIGLQ